MAQIAIVKRAFKGTASSTALTRVRNIPMSQKNLAKAMGTLE
jgi:hypothetical protein